MDVVVVIATALVLYALSAKGAAKAPIASTEVIVPNPRLNPTMYVDENAFMRIANELGFH